MAYQLTLALPYTVSATSLSHLTVVELSIPTFSFEKLTLTPHLLVLSPFFAEKEMLVLSKPRLIFKVKSKIFIFSPTDDDFTGLSMLRLAYTEIGFEESPLLLIVFEVVVPHSAVIGDGSGKYDFLLLAMVFIVVLPAPNVDDTNFLIFLPAFLKKSPISFQNIPSES